MTPKFRIGQDVAFIRGEFEMEGGIVEEILPRGRYAVRLLVDESLVTVREGDLAETEGFRAGVAYEYPGQPSLRLVLEGSEIDDNIDELASKLGGQYSAGGHGLGIRDVEYTFPSRALAEAFMDDVKVRAEMMGIPLDHDLGYVMPDFDYDLLED